MQVSMRVAFQFVKVSDSFFHQTVNCLLAWVHYFLELWEDSMRFGQLSAPHHGKVPKREAMQFVKSLF